MTVKMQHPLQISKDSLVVVWKDSSNGSPGQFDPWQTYMKHVISRGHKVILASPWYLNIISYGQDWRRYYVIEPTNFTDNDKDTRSSVQGGEASVWTEYIDGTNILPLIWPRASAVAERLWSAKSVRDVDSAQFRLDQQRCRMLRRGIPTKPILPGYCGDTEWGMEPRGETREGNSAASLGQFTAIFLLALAAAILSC
ncbi:Beta-hexosaminidase subunit beta [Lamellibrachia satsuma]|nr:Beta-hexosaminidase subunit beta [Lamellibrachia satsuma]